LEVASNNLTIPLRVAFSTGFIYKIRFIHDDNYGPQSITASLDITEVVI